MHSSRLDEKMHVKVLLEWNAATADYPQDRCLHQLFEEQVAQFEKATALVCGGDQIDYRTLNARANQLARFLLRSGVQSGQRVALCLQRSIEMVVAIVGVLKAGCTYVPISPAYPKERMAFMLSDAAPALLITQQQLIQSLPAFPNQTLCLDSLTTELSQESPHNLDLAIAATEVAYIIYTSGSTGIPKGVEVPHRGTYNTTRAHIDLCGIRPSDRLLQFAAFGFDTSILEILMALGAGAALVLVPQDQLLIGESLARLIEESGVTVATLQPSVLASLPQRELPTLRVLLSAGEACTAPLVRRFAPGREFWNAYGPTEGSVCVTLARLQPEDVADGIPPIGRPIPNTRVYILDDSQQPVAIGESGELCIGGVAVAKGYLHRPELTEERFRADPFHPVPGGRLYRTGDLARFRPDGQIEFLGRIDHQVKLHGFRIELGEVESALLRHPSVSQCVVIVREDEPGDRRMCAYVVLHSQAALAVASVRAFLASRLPEFMIPSAFVALPELPLTTHGKIDRAALPPPGRTRPLLGPYQAPSGEQEQQVANLFAVVLRLDEVGATDDFFELGGHSLRAAQVAALIGTRMGISLPVRTLFAHRTVRTLAAYLAQAGTATTETIPRVDRKRRLPLSSSQQQIWLTSLLSAQSPLYNEPYAITIKGPLDVEALALALQALLARHEILRTTFAMQDGQPEQRIHDEVQLPIGFHDLRHLPPQTRNHVVRALHDDAAQQVFDLQTPPLLRAQLVCLAPDEHRLLLVFHHAIFDGVSLGSVLLPELFKIFQAKQNRGPELPPPALQYADYADWEQTQLTPEKLTPHLDYWRRQLAALPVLQLPTDPVRTGKGSFAGDRHPLHLDRKLSEGLLALAQREGTTLYMALVAGLAALLYRYTGQEDLPIAGVVSAQQRPALAGLIGPFVNTIVLRIDLANTPSFRELLRRVRETVLAGLDHSELPFPKLVEELRPERSLGQQPLFQVMCLLDPPPPGAELPPQWSVSRFEAHNGCAMCDFSLQMERRPDGLHGFFEYSRDLFDASTMARWAQHLTVLLSAIVDEPEQPIATLPLLPKTEQAQLATWTGGSAQPTVTACLHELFTDEVLRTPDAVAVVYEGQRLTYAQLDRAAQRLAAQLIALGVGPDQPVGLCAERSPELVVGILGILKAGGAYLPLDPVYPRDRIRFLLEDAQVAVVVTQEQVRKVLPASYAGAVVLLSPATNQQVDTELPPLRASVKVQPDHLAYIIYTSGSTGNPKGVQVSHRNVVRLFSATQPWFDFTAQDVWCLFHSFAFDFSVWELWGALLYGGRLVVVPYWVSRSPESFYRLLSSEKVTILNQTPSAFYQLIAAEQAMTDLGDTTLSLRQVIFGGEALDLGALRPFIDRHGEDRPVLVNMYGITETTVHVTYHRIRRADCDRPGSVIGVPIPDLRLRVLDRRLQPVPIGIAGELLVGGGGVARGYWNRPQLTAERFLDDPEGQPGDRLYRSGDWVRYRPDGALEYLGRIDHQVKIRGFRIELGEIEEAITQHPEVLSALVELREARQGDKRLVAYLVPKTDPNDPELAPRIRSFIERKLPSYMVPAHLSVLAQFPLTPNGKVDRRALPAPEAQQSLRTQYAAPRTYIEEELAAIFAETLGVDRVGVHDSFFELGGHSLLVTRAIFRIREVFHLELPMRALFEAPTVAGLARHLESLRPGHRGLTIPSIVPESREAPLPLSFAQQRLWFLGQLLPDAPSYNEPVTVRFRGSVNAEALARALTEIVHRHEVWRTSFHVTAGQPQQFIHPPVPLSLPIADLRPLPKNEREAEFMRLCTVEAHRPFDLVTGPLVRFVLLIVDDEDARLFLTFHHIIADGLSIYGVFNVELAKLYRAFCAGESSPLPPLPVQYVDYTLWQRRWLSSELIERQLSYWKQQLAAPLPRLQLPEDHPPPPNPTFRGGRELLAVPLELTQKLRRLGHSEGATLFITLLTALKALFYRYIEQPEVVIGIVTAGRQRPELAPLLGFFPNTLVLRTQMSGALSFRGLLRRVREVTLSAFDNQDVPFERVVEACNPERHPGETPLFRVGFILDPPTPELGVDWAMTSLDVELEAAKFDLSLELVEVPHGLVGRIGYRSELFDSSTIARMAGHYVTLLTGIAQDPDQPVAKLPLLTATERAALTSWSAPSAPFPDGQCIHQLFESQVDRAPEHLALYYEGQAFSYRQLDEAANRVAHALHTEGIQPEEIVGICVERSPRLIIAMLGILKAGGAFLVLDPTYPNERLELLAKDANLGLLLSESALQSKRPTPRHQTLLLDDERWQEQPTTRPENTTTARSLGYVIYTSGSTGQPKGVLIEHRGLCSVITAQIDRFGLGPHSRVLQLASLSFDATLYEVFNALFCGGTLVLAPRDKLLPGPTLVELLRSQRITMLTITPSVLAVVPVDPLPELTTLVVAGEALPLSLVQRWASPHSGRRIWNAYGPTEATICASLGECTLSDDPPPIGTVVSNSEIHLLDAHLQPVPVGIPGEICIGGVAIARGYLNRPELTAERFVPSPLASATTLPLPRLYRSGDLGRFRADGRLEYLARIDHQVKVRGFRIEPGEIEAALRLCPGVSDAAVVAATPSDGSKELVAYVVPSGGELGSPSSLRSQLQATLPDFMIPSAFVTIPVLPQTTNGKVDRQTLAKQKVQPLRIQAEYQAPQSDLEQQISQVWREVLHVERVGLADNFFDLGGHSLKMAQVHAKLREVLGKEVSLLTLFQYPTVGALTAFLLGNAQVESEDTARSQERGRLRKEAAALARQRAQGRKQRDE